MSLKTVTVTIAQSAIVSALASLPSGAWFFFSNVRLQGRFAEKPSDSHMPEKMGSGIQFLQSSKSLDANGVPTDILCTVETPEAAFRVDEDGNRVRGTNYIPVTFYGNLGVEARAKAMAWETVHIFGKVSSHTTKEGKPYTKYTAMFLTDGNETVSAQLTATESKLISVENDTQATA